MNSLIFDKTNKLNKNDKDRLEKCKSQFEEFLFYTKPIVRKTCSGFGGFIKKYGGKFDNIIKYKQMYERITFGKSEVRKLFDFQKLEKLADKEINNYLTQEQIYKGKYQKE